MTIHEFALLAQSNPSFERGQWIFYFGLAAAVLGIVVVVIGVIGSMRKKK